MSKSLVLLIPDDDMSKGLVEEYYRRVINEVNKCIEGEISIDEYSEYERKIGQIEEGNVPIIQEGVVDGPLEVIDRKHFDKISNWKMEIFDDRSLKKRGSEN